MSGAELFAGLGLLASELFRYNRENFQFDQEQRFEREELRLKMQLERFALFREDIRDLLELTVGKMDVYHLVGALFLKGCCVYYCTGLLYKPPPPFLLALYYLSLSCSFVYLLLAVWLAMHASISSHSQGTRLLTRFVRLPIPGSRQLDKLNARLGDFERQDKKELLRVPFVGSSSNDWAGRWQLDCADSRDHRWAPQRETHAWPAIGKAALRAGAAAAAGSSEAGRYTRHAGRSRTEAPAPTLYGAPQLSPRPAGQDWWQRSISPRECSDLIRTTSMGSRQSSSGSMGDWLETGEHGIKDNESELFQAVELRTQRHVQMFRQLQARWQSFDAYARVCMALGVRQMLQAVTYFLIGVFMVENEAPMCAFAVTVIFQTLAVAISVMDIHGLPCYGNLDLSLVGMLPALVACTSLCVAPRDAEGEFAKDHSYLLALAAYPLEICWFELLHWVAAPTRDEAGVPSHFRSVLFMDVFGEVDDPTEADLFTGRRILSPEERVQVQMRVSAAEGALGVAQAALRRWQAVPASWLSSTQRRRLERAQRELDVWVHTLDWELQMRRLPTIGSQQVKRWDQLNSAEREEDRFAGAVLGPFEHFTGTGMAQTFYYYDLEQGEYLYDSHGERRVLRLSQACRAVRSFRKAASAVKKTAAGQIKPHTGLRSFSFASSRPETAPSSPSGLVRTNSAVTSVATSPRAKSLTTASVSTRAQVKFKVPRLPWLLTSFMTRVVQLTWICVGSFGALREFRLLAIDHQYANVKEERRLQTDVSGVELITLQSLEADWPHGRFFRPEHLCLLPQAGSELGQLIMGSPYAFYRVAVEAQQILKFEESSLPGPAQLALGGSGTTVCDLRMGEAVLPCLYATPTETGVELRHLQGAELLAVLDVDGAPWQSVAAAPVPCRLDGKASVGMCLQLAGLGVGTDQELHIVIAALPGDVQFLHLQHVQTIQKFQLALAKRPQVLHLEPHSGRLWVLAAGGHLEVWDLPPLSPRRRGQWFLSMPEEVSTSLPLALLADSARQTLLVTARTQGKDGVPVLLQASLPCVEEA